MASFDCFNGYTTSFAIKFISRNGTLVPSLSVVQEKCPVDPLPIIATVFLSFIFISAFVLSTLVLVTIYSSRTLKKLLVYHLFMNLCCIVMVDCLLNLTIVISYVATAPWRFGYVPCYFNSFAMTMLNLEMAFAIFLLALDRLFVAKKYGLYMSLSKVKLSAIIVCTWIASFLLASPLSCGYVSSTPYRNRYSCSVSDPKDQFYLIPQLLLLGLIVPIWLIVCIVLILFIFHHEQKKHRKVRGNQTFSYFDQILMTPYYKNEAYTAFCVVALSVGLLVLWLPFIFVGMIDPYVSNHWNNETTSINEKSNAPKVQIDRSNLDINTRNLMESDFMPNVTSNSTDYSNFVPEMLNTPAYETVFVWFRFIYDLLIPILILGVIKEVRQKCRALVFVCRPNTVDSASPKMISPPYLNASIRGQTPKDKKHKANNMVSFKTPVLFATSEGLHIRTIEETFAEMSDSRPILGFSRGSNVEPQFAYDLCDVTLGNEEHHDFVFDDGKEPPLNIDRSYHDPVVERAHRVAIGQNPNNFQRTLSANAEDKRPPTPPKRRDSTTSSNDSPPSDMIEIDLESRPRKERGKIVRFNTDLNELILRPRTADSDSALEMSAGSRSSTGSGHLADVEEHFAPLRDRKATNTRIKKKQPHPSQRKNNRPPQNPLKPPFVHEIKKTKNEKPSNPPPKKNLHPQMNNIKSRHIIGSQNSLA